MSYILCIEPNADSPLISTDYQPFVELATMLFPTALVDGVSSVAEAFRLIREKQYGIIVFPIEAQKDGAFAALAAYCAVRPTIALIAVIGKREYSAVEQAFSAGAVDYIAEPIASAEFRAALKRQIDRIALVQNEVQRTRHEIALQIANVLPHEFRTPLNGLIGFISLLRTDDLHEEEKSMALHFLGQSVDRLHQTAEKFLLFAELEQHHADKGSLDENARRFATFGVKGLTMDIAMEVLDNFNRQSDVVFHLDGDDECSVKVRAQHLRFLMKELITNACKFSKPQTAIHITVKHDSTFCTVVIQDFGIGFEPEHLSQIGAFNQFRREYHEQQGVGFGLPIIQRILALYGGKLNISSTPKTTTTITVLLPLAPLFHDDEDYNAVQYITMHPIAR